MLNRRARLGTERHLARTGTALALTVAAGGGLVAALPASVASAVGTGADSVSVASSSGGNSTFGDQVAFTATVTPGAGGPPTGTVSFSYTNSNNPPGMVFAVTCVESSSDAVAVAASGMNGTATCTPKNALLAATDTITASYNGDTTFAPGSNIVLENVSPRNTTTSIKVNTLGTPVYGQTVSLTATVTPSPSANPQYAVVPTPGNWVDFQVNGTTTANDVPDCLTNFNDGNPPHGPYLTTTGSTRSASCSTKDLPVGKDSLTGFYSGDGNYRPFSQTATQETISKAATAASTPASSANPVMTGQPVTYTMTVTPSSTGLNPPTGTVNFYDGSNLIPSCSGSNAPTVANNQAKCTVTYSLPGAHSIADIYAGDSSYSASPKSATLAQNVGGTSATTVNASPDTSVYGQSVTFTATVHGSQGTAAPTGTVAFTAGGKTLCSSSPVSTSGGTTTSTCSTSALPVASKQTVTASYSGDANYTASQGTATETVNEASTSTGIASSPNPANPGQQVTFTATVKAVAPGAGAPGGTVVFTDGGNPIPGCGADSLKSGTATCSVTYTSVGTHAVAVSYEGDGNFLGSTSPTISQAAAQANPGATGAIPQRVAFHAANGDLWTVGSGGWTDWKLGVAPNTSPTIANLATGGYELALQGSGGHLWTVGTAGWTNWPLGLASGTSPSITGLSNGGWEVAFQGFGGDLWTVGTAGWTDWKLGVAPGTSPSITSVPNGGFEVAFQGSGGHLWTVGTAGWTNWPLGLASGTSPSITSLSNGGWEVAFQANGGHLWTVGTAGWTSWPLGLAGGTSPSITSLPKGGFEVAFQSNAGQLWTVGSAGWSDSAVSVASDASPTIAVGPSGGLVESFRGIDSNLWTFGTGSYDWTLGMAAATNSSLRS